MEFVDQRIVKTIEKILSWLVEGDVEAVERYSKGVRLSAVHIRRALTDYGRTLTMPPDVSQCLDVVEITRSEPRAWSVRIDLWTAEEGRSDLSLECTLTDGPGDLLVAEVDDLHVL